MDKVVRTLQEIRHEGDHPDPSRRKEEEKIGGAALGGAVRGKEPRAGRPTLATVEDLEGCFDSLAGVAVTGKGVLEELVKSNASLTITIVTLTETNARLTKKVKTLTEALAKREEAE